MFDLALSDTGDIIFQQDTMRYKPLKIRFVVSHGKALRINFQTEDCDPLSQGANGLKISFDINKTDNNKKAIILDDNDAKIQAIKIRIQTTIGDIAGRQSIGSKLELMKHKPLHDKTVLKQAVTMVTEAIADILPNAEVRIQPTVSRTKRGYSQRMTIYIYESDILIFKYDLKG